MACRGAGALERVTEPYFERIWDRFCSHFQTPGRRHSPYVAAVQKGRVVTCAFPVFKTYATHGNLMCRHLVARCLDLLLPDPLLRVNAPSFVEATVTRQDRRHMVHLLSYAPVRRTPTLDIVEEPSLVRDLPLSLRLAKAPARVTLQPQGEEIPFVFRKHRVEMVLPELHGHAMVVFEERTRR